MSATGLWAHDQGVRDHTAEEDRMDSTRALKRLFLAVAKLVSVIILGVVAEPDDASDGPATRLAVVSGYSHDELQRAANMTQQMSAPSASGLAGPRRRRATPTPAGRRLRRGTRAASSRPRRDVGSRNPGSEHHRQAVSRSTLSCCLVSSARRDRPVIRARPGVTLDSDIQPPVTPRTDYPSGPTACSKRWRPTSSGRCAVPSVVPSTR